MEKSTDLETKYQKLAAEYSKVRSQATVLKKAVLDEQAKNSELKDLIKKHEQKIRKHDQEMESLTFRNDQLTKRISVLQQELQNCGTSNKKYRPPSNSSNNSKQNNIENPIQTDLSVLDEELQKKILENAQLVSSMADKEFELNELKERNLWLQKKTEQLEKELRDNEAKYIEEINKLKREQYQSDELNTVELLNNSIDRIDKNPQQQQELKLLRDELERWRTECELLRSKPDNDTQLIEYYEKQLNDLYSKQQLAKSETNTLFAENQALYKRLENLIVDKKSLQNDLDKSNEELILTINNYKQQLDAMTEHLAAQNDKITKQCDEIQVLRHKVSMKK